MKVGTFVAMGVVYWMAVFMAYAILAAIVATIIFVALLLFVFGRAYASCLGEADDKSLPWIVGAHIVGVMVVIIVIAYNPLREAVREYYGNTDPDLLHISFYTAHTVSCYFAFAVGLTKLMSANIVRSWLRLLPSVGVSAMVFGAVFLLVTSFTVTASQAQEQQEQTAREEGCYSGRGFVTATVKLTSSTSMTLSELSYDVENAYEPAPPTMGRVFDKTFYNVKLPVEFSTSFNGQYGCIAVDWGQSLAGAEQGGGGPITCRVYIDGKLVVSTTKDQFTSNLACSSYGTVAKK